MTSRRLVAALGLASALAAVSAASPAVVRIEGPRRVETTEGHAVLAWEVDAEPDPARTFELQESRSNDFAGAERRYSGPDLAVFVSGLRSGRTWFRVRAVEGSGEPGPWSPPVVVAVRYPALGRVTALLALGSVVFVATVGTILGGHLATRRRSR